MGSSVKQENGSIVRNFSLLQLLSGAVSEPPLFQQQRGGGKEGHIDLSKK